MGNLMAKRFDAEHRNAAVRRVLLATDRALTPSQIGKAVNEDWCVYGARTWREPITAAISPVCKRIGAVLVARGQWKANPEWVTK